MDEMVLDYNIFGFVIRVIISKEADNVLIQVESIFGKKDLTLPRDKILSELEKIISWLKNEAPL